MAERRMFAKSIIDSDAFLDMPISARLLYYDLSMRADDDGFCNSPKKVLRTIGASEDDLRILAVRKFIIPFPDGVIVIKHWRIHNYIRKDTYSETNYKDDKALLELDENNAYRQRAVDEPSTERLLAVDEPSTERLLAVDTGKVRLGKDRLGKVSIGNISCVEGISENEIPSRCEEPKEPAFISFPTNRKSEEYNVTASQVNEYKELYPAVDVEQELRNMKGWLLANTSKRKTLNGMSRFINSWLSKAQNSGYSKSQADDGKAHLKSTICNDTEKFAKEEEDYLAGVDVWGPDYGK